MHCVSAFKAGSSYLSFTTTQCTSASVAFVAYSPGLWTVPPASTFQFSGLFPQCVCERLSCDSWNKQKLSYFDRGHPVVLIIELN